MPFFSEKSKMLPKKLITDKKKLAAKLNNCFIKAVENLDIEPLNNNEDKPLLFNDIDEIISHFQTHSGISKIKEKVKVENNFAFNVCIDDTLSLIKEIDKKKAGVENDFPVRLALSCPPYEGTIVKNITKRFCDILNIQK